MEYIKLKSALKILDSAMSDEGIKHKGKAIRKRLNELPTEDVEALKSGQIDLQDYFARREAEFKAEIEILIGKHEVEKGKVKILKEELKTIAVDQKVVKAFAIKEFAERLKDYYIKDKRYDRPNAHTKICFLFDKIENLVEEMVGDD